MGVNTIILDYHIISHEIITRKAGDKVLLSDTGNYQLNLTARGFDH